MAKVTPTARRKDDHLRVSLEEDVSSRLGTGLEDLHFVHNALPELDFNQVDSSGTFLGKAFQAPILISSMTGGTVDAGRINLRLAEAAQATGIAMGLGSQRVAIEDPQAASSFQVRQVAPDILLLANLGAVQLNYGCTVDQCRGAVDMVQADALILHLNPLQEALQPEGDVDFSNLLTKIGEVCQALEVPVVVKEVGWGISGEAAQRLVEVGVSAIDVAGAGGTSWSQVEMHRATAQRTKRVAANFAEWGIPTAECILQIREKLPEIPLIASGGLRSGIDVAKCISLGANLGAMAGAFLEAATLSAEAVVESIQAMTQEIRTCMFATGSPDLPSLREARLVRHR